MAAFPETRRVGENAVASSALALVGSAHALAADSVDTATCKDGNRYRIFVDAQGRVVVQKL